MSEYIYGQVLRGSSRLTLEQVEDLNGLTDALGGLRVYAYAHRTVMDRRCLERGEDLVLGTDLGMTRDLYALYAGDWPCKIDTTNLNLVTT